MTIFRNILRILTTLAALLYMLFFIGEAIPPYDPNMRESNFGIFMVFVLCLGFSAGYYYVWKDERKAGILFATWWLGLFLTAWLVWYYGNVTVILGIPIFILGILLLVYSAKEKASQKNDQ